MLADDNFGNLRTLPTEKERNRKAGFGMYYHFDYHGGPRSYEWVNSTPLEKVWEQMSMAFDYGVKNIWVVNVGDLKPQELPISYFLDLAYDFDTLGTDGINKTAEYTKQWVKQQFGKVVEQDIFVEQDIIDGIATVLSDYTRMNGNRKPEVTFASTYSYINYNEAQRVLTKAIDIENNSKKYYECMPKAYKDVYYQLVHYPAVASANVVKMQIFAGFNKMYYDCESVLANYYAQLVKECIMTDNNMQSYYNNSMSDGKWKGMMSSPHIGYTKWSPDGWAYPQVNYITPKDDISMIIDVEGTQKECPSLTEEAITTNNFPYMTFIESDDVVAIEAEHMSSNRAKSNVEWKVIENYGRSLSSVKMFPTTVSFEKTEDAPYLEYIMNVNEDLEYTLTTYVAPTNNLYKVAD